MIFSEKTEVTYRGMYGVIDFICNSYVVIQLPPAQGLNPARLIVFREYYKEIEILKASNK
jgi:hypothetical protein